MPLSEALCCFGPTPVSEDAYMVFPGVVNAAELARCMKRIDGRLVGFARCLAQNDRVQQARRRELLDAMDRAASAGEQLRLRAELEALSYDQGVLADMLAALADEQRRKAALAGALALDLQERRRALMGHGLATAVLSEAMRMDERITRLRWEQLLWPSWLSCLKK